MNAQRRHLIKLGALGFVLAPVAPLCARPVLTTTLRGVQVLDNLAHPVFIEGDWLLVDAAANSFSGQGHYLYPSWGQPRAYLVQEAVPVNNTDRVIQLEFRNPSTGQLQWTQSLAGEAVFAGKVCGQVAASAELELLKLDPLTVPVQAQYA